MTASAPTIEVYARAFADLKAALPGAELAWLAGRRREALDRFMAAGFPTTRVEAYKYTNLAPLQKRAFDPAPPARNGVTPDAIAPFLLSGQGVHRLVFVDGRYRPDLSRVGDLPAGATVTSLGDALARTPDLVEPHLDGAPAGDGATLRAFNTAFAGDGALIHLRDGIAVEEPIHLVFFGRAADEPRVNPLRILLVAGADSAATVLESYVGDGEGAYWTSAVTEVTAEAGADIRHYRLQAEAGGALHLAATGARLARDSRFASFALSLGGALARNEIAAELDGAGITCALSGVYLARARQHVDTSTWIDHAKPGSASREVYKGVLDDRAHGVFQGRITVRPDAQKTDAHQLNRNLLLSEAAQIDSKPELEIFADDVKCSHGATAGELDEQALFYLRARGIDESYARRLLIEAFVNEVLDEVDIPAVRAHLAASVGLWLPGGMIEERSART